jgi:hypothetical protein
LKLKLSKTSWLILSVGIFIVILVALGLTRSQQLREQSRLNEELNIAEMRLNNLQVKYLSEQQDELQKKLDESTVKLASAKDKLRQTIESIDVTDKFFAIAKSCSANVTSISSSGIKGEKLGGISCSEISVNAVVTGEVSNLINFIIKLNTDFASGVVKSAQLSIPKAADEDKPTANIMMVVYTYEGD